MSDYQTRNYTAHGGKQWRPSEASAGVSAACGANGTPGAIGAHGAKSVIGGKLTFLPGAEVEGLEALLPSAQLPQLPRAGRQRGHDHRRAQGRFQRAAEQIARRWPDGKRRRRRR